MATNQLQIAPLPTTEEVALTLLQWLFATTGVPTDTNQGSIVRTYSEAIGSTEEIQAIESEAQALQALVYSAFTAFGIFPKGATSAVGTVTFSTLSTAPLPPGQSVLIPLNTIVQTQAGIQFATTASAVLVSGTTSINAPVQALTVGSVGDVGIGLINQIASGLTYPLAVTNAAPITGGANAETASQTLARFTAYVQSLGLCSPVAIAGAVIGVAYQQEVVKYSDVYEHWIDQVASGLAPTPGFQVFIDNGSGAASQNLINTVTTYLSNGPPAGFRPAGVPFSVSGVVPIGASVVVVATTINPSIAPAISTAISQSIVAYFNSLGFGETAEFTQLVASIANASFGQLTSLSVSLLDSHGVSQQTIAASPRGQRIILLAQSVTLM